MASPKNPDSRPLPTGWIDQYDTNYHQWFYVNTNIHPAAPTWFHPSETQYPPPSGPPPPSHSNTPPAYTNTAYPSPPSTGGYNPGPGPQYQGASQAPYQQQPYQQQTYQQQPSQSEKKAAGMGGLLGLLGGKHGSSMIGGKHSSSSFGGLYPSQQQSKPPKKHGGMGGGAGLALGAGAGLLGGLLVADAIDDSFDDGFGGGDFDGGDFGDF